MSNCNNSGLNSELNLGNAFGSVGGCNSSRFPDGTGYFQNVAELRQYLLDREANRTIFDINGIDWTQIGGPNQPIPNGTVLIYNAVTQYWVATVPPINWISEVY